MNFLKKIFNQKEESKAPLKQKLSDDYLFRKHNRETIKGWNKILKFGFFKRAWGGHANDGDEFGIWFTYKTKDELLQILDGLNITLIKIPDNDQKAIPGKKYSTEEFEKFKNEIKDFPEYEQPSHISIYSSPCFCWIENGNISLSFSGAADGNRYEVTEIDLNNCIAIEKVIEQENLGSFVSSEYENWVTHISKKYYVELFE